MFGTKRAMFALLSLGLLIIAPLVRAQESVQSEREAMFYRYGDWAWLHLKGGSIQPHWMADGSSFWFAEGAQANTVIWRVDPRANTKTPLFDTARLSKALTSLLGHEPPQQGLPFDEFTFVDGESAVRFTVEDQEFILELDTYKVNQVPPLSEAEKGRWDPRVAREAYFAGTEFNIMEVLSPDRRWFAGLKDHNLWLRSTDDGRSVQVTTDGVQDFEWDVEGAQWSPDSFKLAAKKVDNRQVHAIAVVHWLGPTEQVKWVKQAKPSGPFPQTELFLVDILSKLQVRIDTGEEPDQQFTLLGWRPDGSELLFLRLDRGYKKLELMAANAATGAARVILTETQKTFVMEYDIGTGSYKPFVPLRDGNRFIWVSERDGWKHLYLYDMDGNLIRRLTRGTFPVLGVVAVDEEAGWVYFTAHAEERLYDTHLYRVNMQGKEFKRLTEATGQHGSWRRVGVSPPTEFAPSKEFFLDTHSSTDRPPVVELRRADGKLLQTLSTANIDSLKEELRWNPPEEFVVKAADGKTDLYGVLYKPYDFGSNKKYPVIDRIYGGPFTVSVPRTFMQSWWHVPSPQALAQLGFIVLVVDGRGTAERGKAFHDVVYGNIGRYEIPDHVAALKQLAEKRPYIDLSRVGVYGWSWGGYTTIRAMLQAPDVYHVGIAGNPDGEPYDHEYAPYMGLPQKNKAAYDHASNNRLAGNLKGKLLLIQSTRDTHGTFGWTMKLVESFIRAGKPHDLIVVPDQPHLFFTGPSYRYVLDAHRRYFQEHLQP